MQRTTHTSATVAPSHRSSLEEEEVTSADATSVMIEEEESAPMMIPVASPSSPCSTTSSSTQEERTMFTASLDENTIHVTHLPPQLQPARRMVTPAGISGTTINRSSLLDDDDDDDDGENQNDFSSGIIEDRVAVPLHQPPCVTDSMQQPHGCRVFEYDESVVLPSDRCSSSKERRDQRGDPSIVKDDDDDEEEATASKVTVDRSSRRRRRRRNNTDTAKQQQCRKPAAPRAAIDVDAFMSDSSDEEKEDENDSQEVGGKEALVVPPPTDLKSPPPPPPLCHPPALPSRVVSAPISTSSRSSSCGNDASDTTNKVPLPPVLTETRSASQIAAVNAVLGYEQENKLRSVDDDEYCYYYQGHDCGAERRMKRMEEEGYHNSSLLMVDVTAELQEDELAAVITPDLRRHGSSSTPGAFRAGGGSGVVSVSAASFSTPPPPPPTDPLDGPWISTGSSVVSAISLTRHGTIACADVSIVDSCTTLVSATLVTTATRGCSYSENSDPEDRPGGTSGSNSSYPVLAHAEPIVRRKQRRIVVCMAIWVIVTAVMIGVSVSLALLYTGALKEEKASKQQHEGNATVIVPSPTAGMQPLPSQPAPSVNATAVSSSPTRAPVQVLAPSEDLEPGSTTSSASQLNNSTLAVSWGKVSACSDAKFFRSYNMMLRCGGTINLLYVANATCETVFRQDATVQTTDPSRLSCRLNDPEDIFNSTTGTKLYQEAMATAIFSCTGLYNQDLTATVALPDMNVSSCPFGNSNNTDAQGNSTNIGTEGNSTDFDTQGNSTNSIVQGTLFEQTNHTRRRTALRGRRDLAVQEVASRGGASAFVSLGIFCRPEENATDWNLYQEYIPCETGSRFVLSKQQTNFSDYDDLPETSEFLDSSEEEAEEWKIFQDADVKNFCYSFGPSMNDPGWDQDDNSTNMSSSSSSCVGNGNCTYQLSAIRMSTGDLHDLCKISPGDSMVSNVTLIDIAQNEFAPDDFIGYISGPLQGV